MKCCKKTKISKRLSLILIEEKNDHLVCKDRGVIMHTPKMVAIDNAAYEITSVDKQIHPLNVVCLTWKLHDMILSSHKIIGIYTMKRTIFYKTIDANGKVVFFFKASDNFNFS